MGLACVRRPLSMPYATRTGLWASPKKRSPMQAARIDAPQPPPRGLNGMLCHPSPGGRGETAVVRREGRSSAAGAGEVGRRRHEG